ncbi:MAG: DUF2892 domain-containing protein [Alphaproteobacteria bacterium]|nr:DUF2892 domain-containing protein [Alphaproteobacteria bacterium]
MNIDQIVLLVAGLMVLVSLGLGLFFHLFWFIGAGIIALMMVQSSLTGLCPMVWMLKKFGFKTGKAFN